MKVSHQKIANDLGLTQSTVSRALNGNKRISNSTRESVLKKAYEMGYFTDAITTLNEVLPKLSKIQPNIGLIVEDICNPFFSTIISGVQDQCSINRYNLIIATSNIDNYIEMQNIENFRQLGVKGIILHSHSPLKIEKEIPTVFICSNKKIGKENWIGIDTLKGAFTATEYLIQLGHRQIVFMGDLEKFPERVEGFKKAHKKYNIPLLQSNILHSVPTRISGSAAIGKLLEVRRDFTGIVCCNDFTAFGVMEGIQKCGFCIPEDFSVIGLDNVETSSYHGVELTTVSQPGYEIGKNACELLIEKIELRNTEEITTRMLEYSLVIRKSCRGINEI